MSHIKNFILMVLITVPFLANAQLYTVTVQFSQGQHEMTPKQVAKMTNQLAAIYAANPDAVITRIEANGWEHLNLGGFQYPMSNARANNVLQELNRWESTIPMQHTSSTLLDPIQHIRSGLENQQVHIELDELIK